MFNHRLLAQSVKINGQDIQGPLDPQIKDLASLVNRLMSFLIPLAIIILFFVIMISGYNYMTSGGDPAKLKTAQAHIVSGIIGIVLLVSAYLIAKLAAMIFGFGGGII